MRECSLYERDKSCMNGRSQSLNALYSTYDPEKKNRSDDIWDPDMIIATWKIVYHFFKIESQRLVFPLSKPSF